MNTRDSEAIVQKMRGVDLNQGYNISLIRTSAHLEFEEKL